MDPILIFSNPISGRGRGRRFAERLHKRLTADGFDVHLLFKPAARLTQAELPGGARAAIVIGGDGTLRSVAERLFHVTEPSETSPPLDGPPLLVIPMGTANLMGQHLGLKWNEAKLEDQISAAIARGKVRRLDTAEANGMLFLLVASVGIDAHIVHEVDRRRTGPITKFSYAIPALAAFNNYGYPRLTVTVDGRVVFADRPAMAFVGNIAEYGAGFPILPDAHPTDGLLDVCILPCGSREEMMAHFVRAVAGEHMHGEGVVYLKGRKIRIASPEPAMVQIDGEPAGHTPLDIDLLTVKLPFLVPEE